MEDQLELQGEETLKMSQQSQDQTQHDPNAAARFPGGYTPVGEGVDNTRVETAPSINVGQLEVTTDIDFSNPSLESYGSSGDNDSLLGKIAPAEAFKAFGIEITPVKTDGFTFNPTSISLDGGTTADISDSDDDFPEQKEPIVDPSTSPVNPPTDPTEPPVEPPVEPPTDPEPPVEPPPEPEPPVEPPVEPPTEPEPPVEPPVEPPTESPGKGNPGNDKEVGNSPWDGETGASYQPGGGNHQDGEDPETNQPPGDSKNDGGQNNNSENDNSNGGGGRDVPERGQNNGWGNGDDDAPGNSGANNNAENTETPSGNYDVLVNKFLENHSFNDQYDNFGGRPEFEYDTYEYENTTDVNIFDIPEPMINFEVSDYADNFNDSNYFE